MMLCKQYRHYLAEHWPLELLYKTLSILDHKAYIYIVNIF